MRMLTSSCLIVLAACGQSAPSVASDDLASAPVAAATEPALATDAYKTLMRLIQGEPVTIAASRSLCRELQPMTTASVADAKAWYFTAADCSAQYVPDIEALVTSAAMGVKNIPLADSKTWKSLRRQIKTLTHEVRDGKMTPLRKLEIQQLAWELVAGIRLFRTAQMEELSRVRSETVALLEATLFSHHDLQGLIGGLEPVAADAAANGIASPILQRVLARDDDLVEVTSHTNMHLGLTRGRWSARVFIGTHTEVDRERLQAMLCRSGVELAGLAWASQCATDAVSARGATPLVNLHYEIEQLDAALVLYFNALMEDWTIVSTPIVASWREYQVTGALDAKMDFTEVDRHFRFAAAEYRRQFGATADDTPRYKWLDEQTPVIFGAIDIHPAGFDQPVFLTTQRARCLQCHGHHVRAFSASVESAPSVVTSAFFYPGNSPHVMGDVGYFEKELATWIAPAAGETRGVRQ